MHTKHVLYHCATSPVQLNLGLVSFTKDVIIESAPQLIFSNQEECYSQCLKLQTIVLELC